MRNPTRLMRLVAAAVLLCWPLSAEALTANQLLERVEGAVVSVRALGTGGESVGAGSGVILPSGRIVTSCRRIDTALTWRLDQEGRSVAAVLIAVDQAGDLCLFEPAVSIGTPARAEPGRLRQGNPVHAVGRPRGLHAALVSGRVIRPGNGRTTPIVTTAPVSPGANGGGLFNRRGRLVGLITLDRDKDHWLALPVARALALDPAGSPLAAAAGSPDWHKQAVILEESGDWSGLLAWCRRWTAAETKHADAWFSLGTAYSQLGRTPAALDAYRRTVRLDQQHADAWFNLGLTYGRLGRHHDAITALRRTLKTDPADADAWYQLGIAYLATANRETARAVATELERLDPARAARLRLQAGMDVPRTKNGQPSPAGRQAGAPH